MSELEKVFIKPEQWIRKKINFSQNTNGVELTNWKTQSKLFKLLKALNDEATQ